MSLTIFVIAIVVLIVLKVIGELTWKIALVCIGIALALILIKYLVDNGNQIGINVVDWIFKKIGELFGL